MMRSLYVVEPKGPEWRVRLGSAYEANFSTLGEAVEAAIAVATETQNAEVHLKNPAGELYKVWPDPHQ